MLRPRDEAAPRRRPPGMGIPIGRILGIDIGLDPSWLVIAALIVFSLGVNFQALHPTTSPAVAWLAAAAGALLFFASILLHELAHSVVARGRGVPVLGITLFIFGGISRMSGEPKKPADEFLIAAVGPFTSALLGAFFVACAAVVPAGTVYTTAFGWLGFINFALAIFNLIPGFPLDGGRIFRAAVWSATGSYRRATRWAAASGTAFAYLLMAGGLLVALAFGAVINGLWLVFIGWFLLTAVHASVRQAEMKEVLERLTVRHGMRTDCPIVPPDEPLTQLVENRILTGGQRCFFVASNDHLQGLVTLHEVKQIPRARWGDSRVSDVMLPVDRLASVAPADSLVRAMDLMSQSGANQLPVTQEGRLIGVLTREDILRLVMTTLELEHPDRGRE